MNPEDQPETPYAFERGMEEQGGPLAPPPIPPQATPQEAKPVKEAKGPILSPFALITWILLLGSVFVMAAIMNMGINMVVTVGYVFLSLGAVFGGFLFLVAIKTNGITELKAFLYGNPILVVSRKDGQYERVLGKYGQGTINSNKYGRYFVNPDAVRKDKKSGASIIHVIDSIGTAVTQPFVLAVNVLKEQFGLSNIDQIERAKGLWSRCKKCGIEGVPLAKVTPSKKEDDPTVQEQCKNCGSLDEMDRIDFPKLKIPLYQDFNFDVYPEFFERNQNPDRLNVIIGREVKNELEKEKGFPVKWVALIFTMGMAGFLILLGASIFVPQIMKAMATEGAAAVAPMVG